MKFQGDSHLGSHKLFCFVFVVVFVLLFISCNLTLAGSQGVEYLYISSGTRQNVKCFRIAHVILTLDFNQNRNVSVRLNFVSNSYTHKCLSWHFAERRQYHKQFFIVHILLKFLVLKFLVQSLAHCPGYVFIAVFRNIIFRIQTVNPCQF